MEYNSAVKKKEILPFVTARMDLESNMLSEINQSEKDKNSYMESNKQTELTSKTDTDL